MSAERDATDPDLSAAEYVLGTLPHAEREDFARRLAVDPVLREAVSAWEARLSPLAQAVPPVSPHERAWPAIAARLGPGAARTQEGPDVLRLRRAVVRWRAGAMAAGALAACLAVVLAGGLVRSPAESGPRYVAVVNRGGELPALVVEFDTRKALVRVRSLAAEAPPDRSLELWYVGRDATPRSLGLITGASTTVPAPQGMAPEGATLAVTVEPRGGSPTGTATGPIVYSGRLIRD